MMRDKIIGVINQYEMKEADIMIYFYDQVVIGKYDNHVLFIPGEFDEDLFQEIHIFNDDLEIRWSSKFDTPVKIVSKKPYFKEEMCILGNKSEVKDGYSIVTQYGRKVILPFEVDIKNANHDLKIKVHHLFDEETSAISGYRLVKIKGGA